MWERTGFRKKMPQIVGVEVAIRNIDVLLRSKSSVSRDYPPASKNALLHYTTGLVDRTQHLRINDSIRFLWASIGWW